MTALPLPTVLFRQDERFDVALIDIRLPGMDELQLLEAIKTISPATECIMISAVNDVQTAVECIQKGAHDYLVKPVTPDELTIKIRNAIDRWRLPPLTSSSQTGLLRDRVNPRTDQIPPYPIRKCMPVQTRDN